MKEEIVTIQMQVQVIQNYLNKDEVAKEELEKLYIYTYKYWERKRDHKNYKSSRRKEWSKKKKKKILQMEEKYYY